MKKNKMKGQEQKQKPRRLSLNRETILLLNLLELARGAGEEPGTSCNTASSLDLTVSSPC